jgi:hypothetical protein
VKLRIPEIVALRQQQNLYGFAMNIHFVFVYVRNLCCVGFFFQQSDLLCK